MSRREQSTSSEDINATKASELSNFLAWEHASRDTIDVKKIYIDIAGSLVGGVLLSQIIFWHLPNRTGQSKLSVKQDDHFWLVKKQEDWWDECRISPKEYRLAISEMESKKIIIKKIFKYEGNPTTHLRLNWDGLIKEINTQLDFSKKHFDIDQRERTNFTKGQKPIYKESETTYIDILSKDSNTSAPSSPIFVPEIKEKIIVSPELMVADAKKGEVIIPQEKWDELVSRYGEERVLKSAYELSEGLVNKGYKYKKHYLALRDWIKKDIENQSKGKITDFKPAKKSFRNSYTGAGTLPVDHVELKFD